jgi:hypothetical protein
VSPTSRSASQLLRLTLRAQPRPNPSSPAGCRNFAGSNAPGNAPQTNRTPAGVPDGCPTTFPRPFGAMTLLANPNPGALPPAKFPSPSGR